MNLAARVYTTLYRRVWIMSKDLTADTPIAEGSRFCMCLLEKGALDAYAVFRPEQRKQAAERLDRGQSAVLVLDGGRIAGCVWAATGRVYIPYLDRDIVTRPHEIYTYDAYTHPDYRRRGIATIRNSFLVPEYRGRGYRRAAAVVAFENQVGLRSAEAAGYVRAGVFSCLRLGLGQIDFGGCNTDGDVPDFVRPLDRRPC